MTSLFHNTKQAITDKWNSFTTEVRENWRKHLPVVLLGTTVLVSSYVVVDNASMARVYQQHMEEVERGIKIGKIMNGIVPVLMPVHEGAKYLSVMDTFNTSFGVRPSPGGWYFQVLLRRKACSRTSATSASSPSSATSANNSSFFVDETEPWQSYNIFIGNMALPDHASPYQKFYIRMPFFFTSYEMEMKLRLWHKDFWSLKQFLSPFSKTFEISVPSFLVETSYHVGEFVQYINTKTSFSMSAKVVAKADSRTSRNSDFLQLQSPEVIKTELSSFDPSTHRTIAKVSDAQNTAHTADTEDTDQAETVWDDIIYYVEISEVCRHMNIDYIDKTRFLCQARGSELRPSSSQYMGGIDTCRKDAKHRKAMECAVILGSDDDKMKRFYWTLRNLIAARYRRDESLEKQDSEENSSAMYGWVIREQVSNYDYIGAVVSFQVCRMLFDAEKFDTGYKVRCLANSSFDSKDGMLRGAPYWRAMFEDDVLQRAMKSGSPADYSSIVGICDFCNVTMQCNDWCFRCRGEPQHDYCLQCTYTMANEIIKFEQYLQRLVQVHVDSEFTLDCIKILVAFVIGYAEKKGSSGNCSCTGGGGGNCKDSKLYVQYH